MGGDEDNTSKCNVDNDCAEGEFCDTSKTPRVCEPVTKISPNWNMLILNIGFNVIGLLSFVMLSRTMWTIKKRNNEKVLFKAYVVLGISLGVWLLSAAAVFLVGMYILPKQRNVSNCAESGKPACAGHWQVAICNESTNYAWACFDTQAPCANGEVRTTECDVQICGPICASDEVRDCVTGMCHKSSGDCVNTFNPVTGIPTEVIKVYDPVRHRCMPFNRGIMGSQAELDKQCQAVTCQIPGDVNCVGSSAKKFEKFQNGRCVMKPTCSSQPSNLSAFTGLDENIKTCDTVRYKKRGPDDYTCTEPTMQDLKVACERDDRGCPGGWDPKEGGSVCVAKTGQSCQWQGGTWDGSTCKVSGSDTELQIEASGAGCCPPHKLRKFRFMTCMESEHVQFALDAKPAPTDGSTLVEGFKRASVSTWQWRGAVVATYNPDGENAPTPRVTSVWFVLMDCDASGSPVQGPSSVMRVRRVTNSPLSFEPGKPVVLQLIYEVPSGDPPFSADVKDYAVALLLFQDGNLLVASSEMKGNAGKVMDGPRFLCPEMSPVAENVALMPHPTRDIAIKVGTEKRTDIWEYVSKFVAKTKIENKCSGNGCIPVFLPAPRDAREFAVIPCVNNVCTNLEDLGSKMLLIFAWPVSAGDSRRFYVWKQDVRMSTVPVDVINANTPNRYDTPQDKLNVVDINTPDPRIKRAYFFMDGVAPGGDYLYGIGAFDRTQESWAKAPQDMRSPMRTVQVSVPEYSHEVCMGIPDGDHPNFPFYVSEASRKKCTRAVNSESAMDLWCLLTKGGAKLPKTMPPPENDPSTLDADSVYLSRKAGGSSEFSCQKVHPTDYVVDVTGNGHTPMKESYMEDIKPQAQGGGDSCFRGVSVNRKLACGTAMTKIGGQPVRLQDSPTFVWKNSVGESDADNQDYISGNDLLKRMNSVQALASGEEYLQKLIPDATKDTFDSAAFVKGSMLACPLSDGSPAKLPAGVKGPPTSPRQPAAMEEASRCDPVDGTENICQAWQGIQSFAGDHWSDLFPHVLQSRVEWFPKKISDIDVQCCTGGNMTRTASGERKCNCPPLTKGVHCTPLGPEERKTQRCAVTNLQRRTPLSDTERMHTGGDIGRWNYRAIFESAPYPTYAKVYDEYYGTMTNAEAATVECTKGATAPITYTDGTAAPGPVETARTVDGNMAVHLEVPQSKFLPVQSPAESSAANRVPVCENPTDAISHSALCVHNYTRPANVCVPDKGFYATTCGYNAYNCGRECWKQKRNCGSPLTNNDYGSSGNCVFAGVAKDPTGDLRLRYGAPYTEEFFSGCWRCFGDNWQRPMDASENEPGAKRVRFDPKSKTFSVTDTECAQFDAPPLLNCDYLPRGDLVDSLDTNGKMLLCAGIKHNDANGKRKVYRYKKNPGCIQVTTEVVDALTKDEKYLRVDCTRIPICQ